MDTLYCTALWRQFGAAIDMLDNALVACPLSLWQERLWQESPPPGCPPEFGEFWYMAYHTLFWLELYLSGVPEEEFTPSAPFIWTEIGPAGVSVERPYSKEQLRAYLAALRQTCHTILLDLTDERAQSAVSYPWITEERISFWEVQLYSLRHVQEHAAQLSLFLGQHALPAGDWVPLATDDPGNHSVST